MAHTSWRDDFQRLVPGRAQAYSPRAPGWRLQMPNENVYGNSSLLTTVGDLLIWNANATHLRVGGEAFLHEQLRQGRLTNGEEITYAGGVQVTRDAGGALISHTGATAGYRAYLGRHPDTGWAVAVLCNSANANPGLLGRDIADIVHGRPPQRPAQGTPAAQATPVQLTPEVAAAYAGRYHSEEAAATVEIRVAEGRVALLEPPTAVIPMLPLGEDRFRVAGSELRFIRDAAGAVTGFTVSMARARNVRFERVGTLGR